MPNIVNSSCQSKLRSRPKCYSIFCYHLRRTSINKTDLVGIYIKSHIAVLSHHGFSWGTHQVHSRAVNKYDKIFEKIIWLHQFANAVQMLLKPYIENAHTSNDSKPFKEKL